MTDRFGFCRTTNLDHASKIYHFPVALLFHDAQVIGHGSPFQLTFLPLNWYYNGKLTGGRVYLDKAMPSKSVFSLHHDKRGGPPHSPLPKICQQLPSEVTGEEKVEMSWSCGKNG